MRRVGDEIVVTGNVGNIFLVLDETRHDDRVDLAFSDLRL